MVKNLKIVKNNLAALALATTMIFTSGCSTENKKYEPEVESYSYIYMTEYDDINHEMYWDEKTPDELANISTDIIALKDVKADTLYVASYLAVGYEAALRNNTKSEARENNPKYAENESFDVGYDLGKADKYLKRAQQEQRTYVSIRTETSEEANYYPLDELTVVSYDGANAIVKDYNEENVKSGNYDDLLGQDMSNYIGQEFSANSLRTFATDNFDTLPDALYIVSDDYRHIAEITTATMAQVNTNDTNKIR